MTTAAIDLTAPGISCARCKENIEGDLAGDRGVERVTVDVDARIFHIAYYAQHTVTECVVQAGLSQGRVFAHLACLPGCG